MGYPRSNLSSAEMLNSNAPFSLEDDLLNGNEYSGLAKDYPTLLEPYSAPSPKKFWSQTGGPCSPENTLIVFDWDDTFFPTSALERARLLRIPSNTKLLRPQVQQQLASLAQLCIDTLNHAEKFGTVVIITNSAPGWLDGSCSSFMPGLHPKIRSYPIFAKPMHYLLTYKLDVFKREMGSRYTNLVSIGDGIAERTATLRLIGTQGTIQGQGSVRYCKSVKFKDLPTMAQLVDQLQSVLERFEQITKHNGDLDLRSNFGPISNRFASSAAAQGLNVKGSKCNFVHLSHLSRDTDSSDEYGDQFVPNYSAPSSPVSGLAALTQGSTGLHSSNSMAAAIFSGDNRGGTIRSETRLEEERRFMGSNSPRTSLGKVDKVTRRPSAGVPTGPTGRHSVGQSNFQQRNSGILNRRA